MARTRCNWRSRSWILAVLWLLPACEAPSSQVQEPVGKLSPWRIGNLSESRAAFCLLFSEGTYALGAMAHARRQAVLPFESLIELMIAQPALGLRGVSGKWGVLVLEFIPPAVQDWKRPTLHDGHSRLLYVEGDGVGPWVQSEHCDLNWNGSGIRVGSMGVFDRDPHTYPKGQSLELVSWHMSQVDRGSIRITRRGPKRHARTGDAGKYRVRIQIDGIMDGTVGAIDENGRTTFSCAISVPFSMDRTLAACDTFLPPAIGETWPTRAMLFDGDTFFSNTRALSPSGPVHARVMYPVSRDDWIDWNFPLEK